MRDNMKEKVITVGKVLLPVLGAALINNRSVVTRIFNELRYSGNVTYSDAVKVIMDSDMWSSDKTKAIAILKREETSDYYKAVIGTVKSSMYSSNKLEAIQIMNDQQGNGSA